MKSIKSFLGKIDPYGVAYQFKYREKEKYTTALGGFFLLLFIAAATFMGIYYFIPFYNRENYTTVYYTLTMSETERVSFKESETAFAIGLNCYDGSDGTRAVDLFDLSYTFIYYNIENGEYKKHYAGVNPHQCTKEDFYNKFDETFDSSNIGNYQCFDTSNAIEGIFTSPYFTYYEFDLNAKNKSASLFKKIENYLTENDCKLQMFYSDNTIDISNYEDPIKSFVEAIFIQLNPSLSIRRNIYYMNQHLYDDDYLFWVFGDEDAAKYVKTIFSRYEEYSLYKGADRSYVSYDYENYAKVYLRADTKRTDVKRKYQKFMEFYADASSLLIALYEILGIIFSFINTFWAEQNLSKKIFFFKDLKGSGLNLKQRLSQIYELLDITEAATSTNKTSKRNSSKENIKINNKNAKRMMQKDSQDIDLAYNDDIKIYNAKKGKNNPQNKNAEKKEKAIEKNKVPIKSNKKEIERNKSSKPFRKVENDYDGGNDNYERLSSNYRGGLESGSSLNFKNNMNMNMNMKRNKYIYNSQDYDNYSESQVNTSKSDEHSEEEIRPENVVYDFNLFDVLGSTIFKCCQTKTLSIKYQLNQKANSILFNKLDIVLYVRNMLLLDIINETFLGNGIKDVINFLSRPIISLKEKPVNELAVFYKGYGSSDFNKFYNELNELSQKSDKRLEESLLISLANKHLKSLTA